MMLKLSSVYSMGMKMEISHLKGEEGPFESDDQVLAHLGLTSGLYGSPPVQYAFRDGMGSGRVFSFTINGTYTATYEIIE